MRVIRSRPRRIAIRRTSNSSSGIAASAASPPGSRAGPPLPVRAAALVTPPPAAAPARRTLAPWMAGAYPVFEPLSMAARQDGRCAAVLGHVGQVGEDHEEELRRPEGGQMHAIDVVAVWLFKERRTWHGKPKHRDIALDDCGGY